MDFLNFDNPWLWSLIGFCSFWLWILVIKGLLKLNFDKKYVDTRPDEESIEEETSEEEEEGSSGIQGFIMSIVSMAVVLAVVLAVGLIVLGQLKDTLGTSAVGTAEYNVSTQLTSITSVFNSLQSFVGIILIVTMTFIVLGVFYNRGSDEEVRQHRKKVEYYEDGDEDTEDDSEEEEDETSFFGGEE